MNRYQNLVTGVIVAKPNETMPDFLVKIFGEYLPKNDPVIISGGAIVRIPKDEIIKHNLDLGDTVKLSS